MDRAYSGRGGDSKQIAVRCRRRAGYSGVVEALFFKIPTPAIFAKPSAPYFRPEMCSYMLFPGTYVYFKVLR